MKKIIIATSALTLLSGIAHADLNKICFNYPISNYDYIGGSITDTEYLSPNIEIDDKCLIIPAGRTLSTTPVKWVKKGMTNSGYDWVFNNMSHTGSSKSGIPDELNFAVKLNLYINLEDKGTSYGTYECDNVYLGQGGNGAGINNWWVFANNNSKEQSITCYPVGRSNTTNLVNVTGGSTNHNFNLTF